MWPRLLSDGGKARHGVAVSPGDYYGDIDANYSNLVLIMSSVILLCIIIDRPPENPG
jgi:hypothetical protein